MVVEKQDPRYLELLERKDPTVQKLLSAHDEHSRCLEKVLGTLTRLKVPHRAVHRARLKPPLNFDMVITVGGDGTFLIASHHLTNTPILGVVSSSASVGHFCGANENTFPRVMAELIKQGMKPVIKLQRIEVTIGNRRVDERILNEILICHGNPAGTSRYLISVGKRTEEQKSSGIWVATAAGSTAAIGSAGGTILPPRSRRIQYLVREPYILERDQYHLHKGFVQPGNDLVIASKMQRGLLFIDGSRLSYPFYMGDQIRVALSPHPLPALGQLNRTMLDTNEEAVDA